jgi:DnaK suppressor protein
VKEKEIIISIHLSQTQRTVLSATLKAELNALNRQVDEHYQWLLNVDRTLSGKEQNSEDASQNSDDDDVEVELSNIDREELSAISRALERLERGDYGLCVDCGREIPFARLEVEPQTSHCLLCEKPYELNSLA